MVTQIKILSELNCLNHQEIKYGLYINNVLSVSSTNKEHLDAYRYYLYILNNKNCCELGCFEYYLRYKDELKEIWCPKINHDMNVIVHYMIMNRNN